jgi:hypothetical protein
VTDDARRIVRWQDEVCDASRRLLPAAGVPPEMRDGPVSADGWVAWRPVAGGASEAQLDALEAALSMRLPPLLRAYLSARAVMDFDTGRYHFPAVLPQEPLAALEHLVAHRADLLARRLVPFAWDSDDRGVVALDFRALTAGSEPTVVLVPYDEAPGQEPEHLAGDLGAFFEHVRGLARADSLAARGAR